MKIPKIIHFIWAGGERLMPDDNLYHLIEWSISNPSFQIWLWLDYMSSSHKLDDIYMNLINDVSRTKINYENFKFKDIEMEGVSRPIIRYEIDRLRSNYGASSDLLRYLILYKFGGVYFDSDIKPGTQSLDSSNIFAEDLEYHRLYVDPNSQNIPSIGNDALMSTRANPEVGYVYLLAKRNYSIYLNSISQQPYELYDKYLDRTIVCDFCHRISPARLAYYYDVPRDIEELTLYRTGTECVRLVAQPYLDKAIETIYGRITLIRSISSQFRTHARETGNKWLDMPIDKHDDIRIVLEKVIATIKFEIDSMGILRLDDHIENIAESSGADSSTVVLAFFRRLDVENIDYTNLTVIQDKCVYPEVKNFLYKNNVSINKCLHRVTHENYRYYLGNFFYVCSSITNLYEANRSFMSSGEKGSYFMHFPEDKELRIESTMKRSLVFVTDSLVNYKDLTGSINNISEDRSKRLDFLEVINGCIEVLQTCLSVYLDFRDANGFPTMLLNPLIEVLRALKEVRVEITTKISELSHENKHEMTLKR